jgi:ribonuclease Z
MKMPLWKASKIFLTHLHMDHIGDVDLHVDAGQGFGRLRPLEIWGPTGPTPELGVAAYVENLRKIFGWHDAVKRSIADRRGFDIKTHEFDPGLTGEVLVYDNKDVKIFAYPVPHGIFGPVGYRLEYRGLTFSYAGDCEASMNTVKASMEVDVLIHEAMNTPELLMDYMGLPEIMAKTILWTKHTPPEAAGKVFAMAKPRLAVTFHHFNREDTVEPMVNAVRTVWDGPLLISQDLTVINITPQQIVTRMALVEQRPLLTVDMDYMRRMHVGSQIDEPIYQLPRELDESVIRIDFIEDFKKTAKFMMGVKKVVDTVSIAMDKVKETFSPDHEEGE